MSDPDNRHEEKQFYSCKVVNDVPFKVCLILIFIPHSPCLSPSFA